MKAKVCTTRDEYYASGPGAIRFGSVKHSDREDLEKVMWTKCPGCGKSGVINVDGAFKPTWTLSGEPDAPTLNPSVNRVGCCGWHGWLRNGVWVSV